MNNQKKLSNYRVYQCDIDATDTGVPELSTSSWYREYKNTSLDEIIKNFTYSSSIEIEVYNEETKSWDFIKDPREIYQKRF